MGTPEPDPYVSDTGGLIGQSIGPYKIRELIAVGKRSRVYLAQHAVMGRRCVVKASPPRIAMGEKALQRFRREISITASLQHPNIIAFYDAGKYAQDELIYLVMEYFDGVSLEKKFRGQPAPLDTVLSIGLQIASALSAAHSRRIIHREIAPDNILINTLGLVKVVDFGVAKAYEESVEKAVTDPLELLGSPSYMAPEQTWAADVITPKADIYGLGALLYFCLTGRPPYEGDDPMEIIQKIGTGVRPLTHSRPDTPQALARLINRAMETDPEKRWPHAEALYDALQDVTLETTGEEAPQSLPKEATPPTASRGLSTDPLSLSPGTEAVSPTQPESDKPQPYLRIFGAQEGCWEYQLKKGAVVIGRSEDADIELSESYVSRHHARILAKDENTHVIEDLKSRVGVTLNGEETQQAELQPGDTVQIGHYILQYRRDGKYVGDSMKHFPLNFLPSSMTARYRIIYFPPDKAFSPGDTLPIGQGGIYIPVQMAPVDDVCVEVELAWPNGKKRTFLAEILGTLPHKGMLLMCLKLHKIDKGSYERLLKRSKRGMWDTAPQV